MSKNENIEQLMSSSEQIGVIGSPSTTGSITLDILGSAAGKKLVGELAFFKFMQDGKPHYALGQITEIQMRNVTVEDPTIRSLIRQRGYVNYISGSQDTHVANMTVGAVFSDNGGEVVTDILGTVPSTGTPVYIVNDSILDWLLDKYKDEIFYLGRIYGSTPRLPMWFRHFGAGVGGAGEAYHIGIFGKSGSGKSSLAKMILIAYARHPEMSIFVIDPQGEFSKSARGNTKGERFAINLYDVIKSLGKEVMVKSVKDLVLDRWSLFGEILYESSFFDKFSVSRDNKRIACDILVGPSSSDKGELQRANITLDDLHTREAFEKALQILGDEQIQKQLYKSEESRNRFKSSHDHIMKNEKGDKDYIYRYIWYPIAELFNSKRSDAIKVDHLIYETLNSEKRPVVVVDLSTSPIQDQELLWDENIQSLVIKRLLDGLIRSAEDAYKKDKYLNTLVVFDEAHKFAGNKVDNEKTERVRDTLLNAIRTTRKYGLGWMFISQRPSGLHREIIDQLRIFFFGFGLAIGTEFMTLKEIVSNGSNALELYKSFRDPSTTNDKSQGQYSFMAVGPISPLSFSDAPLFFTAFNTPEEFFAANGIDTKSSKKSDRLFKAIDDVF
jgi:DNA helicase HerA-like ATPase